MDSQEGKEEREGGEGEKDRMEKRKIAKFKKGGEEAEMSQNN